MGRRSRFRTSTRRSPKPKLPPADDFWASLAERRPLEQVVGRVASAVPPDRGFTTTELAAQRGLSRHTARYVIAKLLAQGHLRMIGFRVGKDSAGRRCYSPVYDFVKPTKKE
jgi:hypothetical protein